MLTIYNQNTVNNNNGDGGCRQYIAAAGELTAQVVWLGLKIGSAAT